MVSRSFPHRPAPPSASRSSQLTKFVSVHLGRLACTLGDIALSLRPWLLVLVLLLCCPKHSTKPRDESSCNRTGDQRYVQTSCNPQTHRQKHRRHSRCLCRVSTDCPSLRFPPLIEITANLPHARSHSFNQHTTASLNLPSARNTTPAFNAPPQTKQQHAIENHPYCRL